MKKELNKKQLVESLKIVGEVFAQDGKVIWAGKLVTDEKELRTKLKTVMYSAGLSIKIWDDILEKAKAKQTVTLSTREYNQLTQQVEDTRTQAQKRIQELEEEIEAYQELIHIIDDVLNDNCLPPVSLIIEDYKRHAERIINLDI